MENWEIAKPAGVCSVTGRPLAEGEDFYAVIFEEGESLRRADYSLTGWNGPPPGCFCYFRTRLPVKAKKKRVWVDNEVLISLFQRLGDAAEPSKINFRFVLALMLMRKRIIKYEDSVRDDQGREFWIMRLTKAAGQKSRGAVEEGPGDVGVSAIEPTYRVLNPNLREDEIQQVTQQLSGILYGQGDFDQVVEDQQIGAEG